MTVPATRLAPAVFDHVSSILRAFHEGKYGNRTADALLDIHLAIDNWTAELTAEADVELAKVVGR